MHTVARSRVMTYTSYSSSEQKLISCSIGVAKYFANDRAPIARDEGFRTNIDTQANKYEGIRPQNLCLLRPKHSRKYENSPSMLFR